MPTDKVFKLVSDMRQRKIPIDGVGLQMHISLSAHPPLKDIAANMARLHELSLEVTHPHLIFTSSS